MLLIFPVGVVGSKQQNEAQPRTTTEEFMVQPLWIPFPTTMTFSRHEAEWIAAAFRPNASGSVRRGPLHYWILKFPITVREI